MAQAGIHALVGTVVQKIAPKREWFMLGIILGSISPDLDNYTVAIATLAKLDTHGLHRTFTHSIFTIVAIIAIFYVVSQARKEEKWTNLGLGFGTGIGLHILLDLLIWFNGVELLWPFGGWVNLWEGMQPPEWFIKLMDPAEFLFFGLYFAWLGKTALDQKTDTSFYGKLRFWMLGMLVLVVVFTPLAYLLSKGFLTIYGAVYLVAITAAFAITIRMRETVEAFVTTNR